MDNEMLDDFFIEAEELFSEAEDSLLEIEKGGDFNKSFNYIFRTFHSIKGAAGMFGFEALQEHMHYVENLLESKKNDGKMSEQLVDYLLNAIDIAKKKLKNEDVSFTYHDPDDLSEDIACEVVAAPDTNLPSGNEESDLESNKHFTTKMKLEISNRLKEKSFAAKIMIVDDEVEILDITKEFLQESSYDVITFSNPEDAVEQVAKVNPDMIITDISMPQMDGVELLQKIRKIFPYLPVIIISGFVTKDVCMSSVASGVAGILEKPMDPNLLLSTIDFNVKKYQNIKLLGRSIDLLVYQFEGFDKFLAESQGETKRDAFRDELKSILKRKKILAA